MISSTESRTARRITGGVAAAVVLLGASTWWADGGSASTWSAAEIVLDADAPAARVEGFGVADGASSVVVGYEHDTYASGQVRLTNLGGDRQVESVQLVVGERPLLVQVEDGVAGAVDAGASYAADVVVRFDNCEYYHEREASLVHEVEVTSRVDGRTVVERVPLVDPMFVRSPMLWQCPDRTIDRQDQTRSGR